MKKEVRSGQGFNFASIFRSAIAGLCLLAVGLLALPTRADLQVTGLRSTYSKPYLLDFTFSLRDAQDHAVVTNVSKFKVVCKENGVALDLAETAWRLLPGDSKQLECFLVLDYTLSMLDPYLNPDDNGDGVSDSEEAMVAGAKTVIGTLGSDAQVGVYEFHRSDAGFQPQKIAALTVDKQYLSNRIDGIYTNVMWTSGGTRCWDALYLAVSEFPTSNPDDDQRFVVFLSDGRDTSSAHSADEVAGLALGRGVKIYCVGYGSSLTPAKLQALTSQTGGRYYPAANVAELRPQFEQIAHDLGGQYVLRWATLKTVGGFTPSFEISLDTETGTASGPGYSPESYAGDSKVGRLSLDSSVSAGQKATLVLRAAYIPRGVTRIKFNFATAHPVTVSRVLETEGGVCPSNWTYKATVNQGIGTVELSSPTPDNPFSALKLASLGKLVKLQLEGVTNVARCFYELTVDNSIYPSGASLVVENPSAYVRAWPIPTITFEPVNSRYVSESPFTLSGNLPLIYRVLSGPATVQGNQVTLTGVGRVTIRGEFAGDDSYRPGYADVSFDVLGQLEQSVSFPALAARYVGEVVLLQATASSGLPVSFQVVSGSAALNANQLTVTGPGTILVRASQAGNAQYKAAALVEQTIVAKAKESQTLSFAVLANRRLGETFSLAATANSGLPVTLELVSGPATLVGTQLTCSASVTGLVTIRAEQAGDTRYLSAAQERTFEVLRKPQKIATFDAIGTRYVGETVTLNAAADSGLPVAFKLLAGSALLAGNKLTILDAGTVEVRAEQLGNAQFEPATPRDQSFVAKAKESQTISFAALPDRLFGEVFMLTATASSGLPVTFRLISGPVVLAGAQVTCSVSATGLVTIRAEQAGDLQYNPAAPVDRSFGVRWELAHQTPAEWLRGLGYTGGYAMAELADLDGDGQANWQEYLAGTNPTNRASVFKMLEVTRGGNGWNLKFSSESNRVYRVDSSADLKTWQTLQAGVKGNGLTQAVVDGSVAERRFYKAVMTEWELQFLPFTNGTGMGLAWIKSGKFTMGSPISEAGRFNDEGPQTEVTLTKGYWLGKHEVTQAQYEAVMGTTPSYFKGARLPVEMVSWTEAVEFCRKLTERERSAGKLPAGYEYRLPTEAQWEYACRAGTTTRFSGGDADSQLGDLGWYADNSGFQTHPVGLKQPNAWGLYDMHGNVQECCADRFGSYPGGSVTDPTGASPDSGRVVLRGGSMNGDAGSCRSADRTTIDPDHRYGFVGFRAALVPIQ